MALSNSSHSQKEISHWRHLRIQRAGFPHHRSICKRKKGPAWVVATLQIMPRNPLLHPKPSTLKHPSLKCASSLSPTLATHSNPFARSPNSSIPAGRILALRHILPMSSDWSSIAILLCAATSPAAPAASPTSLPLRGSGQQSCTAALGAAEREPFVPWIVLWMS